MMDIDFETSNTILAGNGYGSPAMSELTELTGLTGVASQTTRTALAKLAYLAFFLREGVSARPQEGV